MLPFELKESFLHVHMQFEFSYVLEGEIHTSSMSYTTVKPIVQFSQFTKVALADDSYWLMDFLQAEGQMQDQSNPGVAVRTETAVGQAGGGTHELHTGPHQSSLRIQRRLMKQEEDRLQDK